MPKPVIITTSREPSKRTRSFIKDLACLAPWIIRLTRGKLTFTELIEHALGENASTLAIVCERKANPSIIRIYDLTQPLQNNLPIHAYTLFLKGITLSREKGRRTANLQVEKAVIESEPPSSDTDRDMVLAAIKLFNAEISSYKESNALIIRIKKEYWGYKIEFKDSRTSRWVGPIIRVEGVKKIGRPAGPT